MTTDKKRELLEAAAKACGIECEIQQKCDGEFVGVNSYDEYVFNPINNSADCAAMCAKLKISTIFQDVEPIVACHAPWGPCALEDYATEAGREAAWRFASTMVAAKVGGYTD